ncbi:hypothetical protein V8E54_005242 [Elaphomyces granulatus]|jgi:hypothetical protein
MAQAAIGRLFRCQSCFRQSLISSRGYSKNAIPSFAPTSSTELDQILNRFREELFIPVGLGARQRRLIFQPKYSEKLEEEPITVTIGQDETFQLRPLDPQSLPRKEEIVQVVSLMKTTKDWQNIIPFLVGMRMSRRFLTQGRWEWLIRKAGEADSLGIILELAKQSDKTGLKLKEIDIVHRLFFALHQKAQAADFEGDSMKKALSLAKQFAMLLEAPEHINHNITLDPKRRPFIIGVLLELSAARALDESEGRDEGGHVKSFAEKLLASWAPGSFDGKIQNWVRVDRMLQENVPIWNGIRLTLQVHGIAGNEALSTSLRNRLQQLSTLIDEQQKLVPEKVKERPTQGYKQSLLLYQN